MKLDQISAILSDKWANQSNLSLSSLEYNLMDAIRNLEYDSISISDLCITPLNAFQTAAVLPVNILHIIIGFISLNLKTLRLT